MQANRETPLAGRIQEKLDHQGFLTSEELNPFLCLAIENAMRQDGLKGILIDGFPRCEEQLNSWTEWPFQDRLRLVSGAKRACKSTDLWSLTRIGGECEARCRIAAQCEERKRRDEVPRAGS